MKIKNHFFLYALEMEESLDYHHNHWMNGSLELQKDQKVELHLLQNFYIAEILRTYIKNKDYKFEQAKEVN